MRAYFIIIKSNLLKRKTYSFSLLVLTLLATVSLLISVGIISKISNRYEQSYVDSGDSELIFGFTESQYNESFAADLSGKKEVKSVEEEEAVMGVMSIEDDTPTIVFDVYKSFQRPYNLRSRSNDLEKRLKSNEILIPLNFQDEYGYQVEDTITIGGTEYVVKGIFEDPIYGSPYYHTKRVLVSEEMLEQVKRRKDSQKLFFLNIKLHNRYKEKRGVLKETISEINHNFDNVRLFFFDRISLSAMRTTVPRIILIILFCLSLFLLLILSIVISYAIMASIEDDYSSLGVLKALGAKTENITWILVMQYGFLVVMGIVLGTIISYALIPVLGSLLLKTSGILWKGNISVTILMLVIAMLFLFVVFIVYLQAIKTKKISPVEAIKTDKTDSFPTQRGISLHKFPYHKLSISARMSLKQITTDLKQYLVLFILTLIFSVMILTVLSLSGSFSSAEKVASILGYDLNDLSIEITYPENASKHDVDKLVNWLDKEYTVDYYSVYDTNAEVFVNNNKTQLLVFSEFQTSNILKGRAPETSNEVIISQGISDELKKSVGDKLAISLSKDSPSTNYEIVGINNQVYKMGKNISMLDTGLEMLDSGFIPLEFLIKLGNNEELEKIIDKINKEFLKADSGISVSNELEVILKRIGAIQLALNTISYAVIVISLILISVITLLVSIVLIKRETFEFGVLKAIGFTATNIRLQFTIRFLLISFLGSISGLVLMIFSNNFLVNSLFSLVNIVSVPSGLSISSYLFCVCFIVLITGVFAWLVSRKIKVIEIKSLMIE